MSKPFAYLNGKTRSGGEMVGKGQKKFWGGSLSEILVCN
jgi:hypothetical protein